MAVPEKDVFGVALRYYYQNKDKFYKIPRLKLEREDGWKTSYSMEEFFSDQFTSLEEKGISLSFGKIMDLGAGSGRHSLRLQQIHLKDNVVAVDESPLAAEILALRGIANVICSNWKDLLAFGSSPNGETSSKQQLPFHIDTILMLNNSFGMIGELENIGEFLESAKAWMNVTGQTDSKQIIFDCSDPTKDEEVEHLQYFEIQKKNGRYIGTATVRFKFQNALGNWIDWLYVDPETLTKIGLKHGWNTKIVEIDPANPIEYLAMMNPASLL